MFLLRLWIRRLSCKKDFKCLLNHSNTRETFQRKAIHYLMGDKTVIKPIRPLRELTKVQVAVK